MRRTQIVQLELGKNVRLSGNCLLDFLGVFVEGRLASGDNLREDAESVT
jgi:hypothetical protein